MPVIRYTTNSNIKKIIPIVKKNILSDIKITKCEKPYLNRWGIKNQKEAFQNEDHCGVCNDIHENFLEKKR